MIAAKAIASLENDRRRSIRHGSLVKGHYLQTDESDDEQPDFPEDEDGGNELPQSTRQQLQALVRKIISIAHVTGSRRRTRSSSAFTALEVDPSYEEREAIASILRSSHLMRKTCDLLFDFQQDLFGVLDFAAAGGVCEDSPVSRIAAQKEKDCEDVINLFVGAIHKVKWYTIRTCWKLLVQKQHDELGEKSRQLEELQKRFQSTRSDYLKEVSLLRDQARVRVDVDAILTQSPDVFLSDLVFYFDPTTALSSTEAEFFFKAVREKVVMLLEHNPRLSDSLDIDQMQRLKDLMESKQVTVLKEALTRKNNELLELKRVLVQKQHLSVQKHQNSIVAASVDESRNQLQEKIIADLEEKVTDLRSDLLQARNDLKKASLARTALSQDADQLQEAVQLLDVERSDLLVELHQLKQDLKDSRSCERDAAATVKYWKDQFNISQESVDVSRRILSRMKAAIKASSLKILSDAEEQDIAWIEDSTNCLDSSIKFAENSVVTSNTPNLRKKHQDPQQVTQSDNTSSDISNLPHLSIQATRSLPSSPQPLSPQPALLGEVEQSKETSSSGKESGTLSSHGNLLQLLADTNEQLRQVADDREEILKKNAELERDVVRLQNNLMKQSEGILFLDQECSAGNYTEIQAMTSILMEEFHGNASEEQEQDVITSPTTEDVEAARVEAEAAVEELQAATRFKQRGRVDELRLRCIQLSRKRFQLAVKNLISRIRKVNAEWKLIRQARSEDLKVCSCGSYITATTLYSICCELQQLLHSVSGQMNELIEENLELRQKVTNIAQEVTKATATLSRAVSDHEDVEVQNCVKRLQEVPAVFQRLWQDSSRRNLLSAQKAELIRAERRAAVLASALIHLSASDDIPGSLLDARCVATEPDMEPPTRALSTPCIIVQSFNAAPKDLICLDAQISDPGSIPSSPLAQAMSLHRPSVPSDTSTTSRRPSKKLSQLVYASENSTVEGPGVPDQHGQIILPNSLQLTIPSTQSMIRVQTTHLTPTGAMARNSSSSRRTRSMSIATTSLAQSSDHVGPATARASSKKRHSFAHVEENISSLGTGATNTDLSSPSRPAKPRMPSGTLPSISTRSIVQPTITVNDPNTNPSGTSIKLP